MSRKKAITPADIEAISQNIITVMPLLRKHLLHMDLPKNEYGIPLSCMQVLSMLSQTGSMSMSELSNRLSIAKPNVTTMLDRLVEDRLVERIRDIEDRRVVNITISATGREKLAAIQANICEHVQEWAEGMRAVDFRALVEAFETIGRVLSGM